jgi:uncharacterized protein (TIGR02265 family)
MKRFEQEPSAEVAEEAYITFESILKGLGAFDNQVVLQTLKSECNFDLKRPKRYYSYNTFRQFMTVLHRDYFPNLTFEEACRKMGQLAYSGYRKTIVGRVATAALHLFSPERALTETITAMNRDMPHQQRELIRHTSNHFVLQVRNDFGIPHVTLGLIEGAVATIRVSNPQVILFNFGNGEYNIDIRWQESANRGQDSGVRG